MNACFFIMISSFQIDMMYKAIMADSDEMDNMSEDEGFVKKCPRCTVGVIAFDGDTVGSWGECHNEECHKKQDNYGYEVITLQPFTAKYSRPPLHTYTMPARIPWSITKEGLKFSMRDDESGFGWDEVRDAVLLTLEGLTDWMDNVVESMEWDGVDWDEYEVEDNGITEVILEDTDLPVKWRDFSALLAHTKQDNFE